MLSALLKHNWRGGRVKAHANLHSKEESHELFCIQSNFYLSKKEHESDVTVLKTVFGIMS